MIDSFRDEYRWLSNFYPCVIEIEGLKFGSVESGFQSMKTSIGRERFCILSPSQAKKLGRAIVLREDWEEIKVDIMRELLLVKFGGGMLKVKLLNTGSEELVEGNWWGDKFWGVCDGVGENMLGKLLMEVRNKV